MIKHVSYVGIFILPPGVKFLKSLLPEGLACYLNFFSFPRNRQMMLKDVISHIL